MVIVGFDLETTDAEPSIAMPVQVSAVLTEDGNERVLMDTLCNPHKPIAEGATEVHGISDKMVQLEKSCYGVAKDLGTIIAETSPDLIITYNGSMFDIPIVERLTGTILVPGVPRLDVLDLAYRYMPDLTSRKLVDLYKYAFGKELEGAHDASTDVFATIAVANWFSSWMEKTQVELAALLAAPKAYEVMPIGKHRGKPISQIPVSWARYMQNNAGGMRPDLALTVQSVLRR